MDSMAAEKTRTYKAIVWVGDRPGQRLTLEATDLEQAEKYLREKFGQDIVFTLYNEEDANRPR